MKTSCWIWACYFALALGLASCSSLDTDTTNDSSTQTKAPVPGEVNPDAPDAAQNLRTTPGLNF